VAILLNRVTKSYGSRRVVDDVTTSIDDGSLTVILGPSGSGKSTLLRLIAGLETLDSGTVAIDGQDVTFQDVRDRNIGFCFQHYAPFRHMTVAKNVGFGLKVRKQSRADIDRRVGELLEIVRLSDKANRYPSQLSGGERQRMALARALAIEPRVLLLDEPFGALDAQVRVELRSWLRDFHHRIPVTTIMVTHDQQEAMEVADQLIIMAEGAIQQTGDPRHIYASPSNEFVQGFLGPITNFGGVPVRPHDLEIRGANAPGEHAVVTAIQNFGFEVRVDLRTEHDTSCWVQLSTREAETLSLSVGDAVTVSVRHEPALMI